MYCTRCGKKIDYDSSICLECTIAAAEEANKQNAQEQQDNTQVLENQSENEQSYEKEAPVCESVLTSEPQTPAPNTRMAGFGKALAAVIVSNVSIVTFAIATVMLIVPPVSVFLNILTIAASVVSIVLGIKSIITFVRVKREGKPVPIATLVMGIAAISESVFIIIYSFIILCVGFAIIANPEFYDEFYSDLATF